ncbi:hypothetical protein LTS18_007103 [Coniosporium uncinatum]|uniref:Uncharacterized protein n=1 Tax=Coniosporium uncinatum TaxID=93489 RepID=A0ACC3D3A4_9PEZI|nr:hypothetical protein LTS18_007103 [Coniosporium uncinatum]
MQGFNMGRYVPPEALDAGLSGNQASGKGHALGARARKIGQGILTVRFEMPFATWCSHCEQQSGKPVIIGQGVRFNAEKKKVGNYHSTSIWAFRMKHSICGGVIEIRTDPKAADYIVHEGGKRRDYGKDEDTVGKFGGEILTEEERDRRRTDAFAALEGKVGDKERAKEETDRVRELYAWREKQWEDPYTVNQNLRRPFRAERKVLQRKAKETEDLKDRFGLGMDLLEESEADRTTARFVEFGVTDSEDRDAEKARSKPLFALPEPETKTKLPGNRKQTKAEAKAVRHRTMLHAELTGNTRAAMDPFLTGVGSKSASLKPRIPGLRRKEASTAVSVMEDVAPLPAVSVTKATKALVNYDSD